MPAVPRIAAPEASFSPSQRLLRKLQRSWFKAFSLRANALKQRLLVPAAPFVAATARAVRVNGLGAQFLLREAPTREHTTDPCSSPGQNGKWEIEEIADFSIF
eukprot:COSAG04_NODE_1393_length_6955_cov_5.147754_2_plen_103_part_00